MTECSEDYNMGDCSSPPTQACDSEGPTGWPGDGSCPVWPEGQGIAIYASTEGDARNVHMHHVVVTNWPEFDQLKGIQALLEAFPNFDVSDASEKEIEEELRKYEGGLSQTGLPALSDFVNRVREVSAIPIYAGIERPAVEALLTDGRTKIYDPYTVAATSQNKSRAQSRCNRSEVSQPSMADTFRQPSEPKRKRGTPEEGDSDKMSVQKKHDHHNWVSGIEGPSSSGEQTFDDEMEI